LNNFLMQNMESLMLGLKVMTPHVVIIFIML
jgi:hypothetical protein